ncbi:MULTISPECIES: hypothetical protein [Rhodomicrobium]|uniref:hypothetical protein n=1 Tax=Rhodomicrobium TaxID=1068 RepID=UPI000B4BFCBD|nr:MULTISPECIES: hypothetical protein [Rhodomicrobium]
MHRKFLPALGAVLLAALMTAASIPSSAPASAQAEQRVRVRGTVIGLSGQTLSVKTREGATAEIALADGYAVAGVVRASLADIKPGDFVGIASLPKSSGGDGALEVLIFPPAMKGTNEGSYGWDLQPNSTMTNGSVANAVKDVDGHTVTVTYKGGEKKINVPEGTPVVTFAAATPADLKAGAAVFVNAEKGAGGAITARRVAVGLNGVVPPM